MKALAHFEAGGVTAKLQWRPANGDRHQCSAAGAAAASLRQRRPAAAAAAAAAAPPPPRSLVKPSAVFAAAAAAAAAEAAEAAVEPLQPLAPPGSLLELIVGECPRLAAALATAGPADCERERLQEERDMDLDQPLADLEDEEQEDETYSTLQRRHWGDDARVRRFAAIVECHSQFGQPTATLTQLLIREQNEDVGAALSSAVPCFSAFRRACSAEPGWASVLAAAWRAAAHEYSMPPALDDFVAALQFAERQLRNLGAGGAWGVPPHSLLALLSGMPAWQAAGLLFTCPQRFQQLVEPWLRAELLWGDADVAAAALSEHYANLQSPQAAQRSLDWLLGVGLTRGEAGRALRGCLPMLSEPPPRQERIAVLAAAWGVGAGLAAGLALMLGDGGRVAGSRVDLIRELLEGLLGEAGMSEGEVLQLVLDGGLSQCTRNERALLQGTTRLKHLLLVHGGWRDVTDVLLSDPLLLSEPWEYVGRSLTGAAQLHAWQAVQGLEAASEAP